MTQLPDLADRFTDDRADCATCVSWLSHEGIIAVDGADTDKFLQGQITCDLKTVSTDSSSLGARCNPKGRMQSSFRLWRSDQGVMLSLAHELIESQLADLAKYAVFYKCQLTNQSEKWIGFGIWGEAADAALQNCGLTLPTNGAVVHKDNLFAIGLPGGACSLWVPTERAGQLLDQLCQYASPVSLNQWLLQQIQSGVGQVTGPTRESFIPQMLNLQQLGGVSFRKGCYTGQEIVARMQYLGKLKRRMYRLLMAGEALPPPGTEIVDRDSGKAVGEVVMAARGSKAVEMLAVLQKDAAQLTTLSAGDSDGPLISLADLPYERELTTAEAE
ncbi:tRNA-modifying protein YgfZ [Halopseudomonas oceani]|uniref:Folate-binding protein YgfZ n=1 Tax=Halopseudomonas oceani TaxID=1708783 RepID=A0A2P4EYP2_9GAMM|nr:folate-binding protein YgfZ [Halopseudomonas oceani]POB05594.1 folate-binding protein YgfZ [Halopseudomonas oceani]GGE40687.1 tRNA-modifying protein YgfZ [Halopseudomonas oceani]